MRIDVWSDVACPWCYVGKRNLEAALARTGLEAEIHWRAFELDPDAPAAVEGSMAEAMAAKYQLSVEQIRGLNERMTQTALEAGLEYRLEQVCRANSFDAHRLAKLAELRGLGPEMAERLFAAYFCEGALVSSHEILVELGAEVGLDPAEAAAVLGSDELSAEVREDERDAAEAGFSGVPTFVIEGQYVITGAQPVDTMADALRFVADAVAS